MAHAAVVSTALGWVGLAATERGLAAATLPEPTRPEAEQAVYDLAAVQGLTLQWQDEGATAPADLLRRAAEQLQAYFAGEAVAFDVPVDLSRLSPFRQRVLQALCGVPPGAVVTYGELARQVGAPSAARAVGQALHHNPVAPIVPCHRVVGASGALTGYGGGLDMKRLLLRLEGEGPAGSAAGG